MQLTPEQHQQFQQDGVILVKNAFDSQLITDLLTAVLEHYNRYKNDKDYFKIRGRFRSKALIWDIYTSFLNPGINDFIHQSDVAEIAKYFLGSKTLRLVFDNLLIKLPSKFNQTPWHDDTNYLRFDGQQVCRTWIPCEAITPETSHLEFIRGSHLWKTRYANNFGLATNNPDPRGHETMPDIESHRDDYDIIRFDHMDAGDCLVFYDRSIHHATAQLANHTRHALSVLWVGDDVSHDPLDEENLELRRQMAGSDNIEFEQF